MTYALYTKIPFGAYAQLFTPQDWHHLSTDEVLALLESDGHDGLSSTEAEARLARFGPNTITARRGPHILLRFMQQFNNPLIYVLLVAGITTALIPDHAVDSIAIFAVILVNAIVGFVQESRAQAAIAALSRLVKVETSVMRDGHLHRIDASTLVPGDVILLQSGDRVPADIRILRQREVQIDEAMLTGESLPVAKEISVLPAETTLADRKNMAYSGTLVTFGQATCIVTATGEATELGAISNLLEHAETIATPLTHKLSQFSYLLSWVIIGLAVLTFAIGLLRGQQIIDTFIAAVALAVAAIPEGLPAAVTIILAIGVTRMAERNAVIRKLPAVETLGSTSVICSDKTGTLTKNEMTVSIIETQGMRCFVTGTGYQPDGELLQDGKLINVHDFRSLVECLHAGILCSDAQLVEHAGQWHIEGDPTEGALLTVAWKAGIDPGALRDDMPTVDTIPFESERQYMASLRQLPDDDKVIYVKGAAERILSLCQTVLVNGSPSTSTLERDYWRLRADILAGQGLRVLAFAMKTARKEHNVLHPDDLRDGLIFLGLQGMIDPPRPEAIMAVQACQRAGVSVKMITGDHALTARTIAAAIGIGGQEPVAMTGQELTRIPDEELASKIQTIDVFARVAPEQKLRLVKALQAQNAVVAMTGDGVNDAPALKQANIGIAMGVTGTEAAKDAADMVLTDDNFASIEAAVEEGRGVYENLRKFITWTLPTNVGEGLLVVTAIALGIAIPILPLHLLWINLVTTSVLGITLAFEPKERGLMQRPARDPREPILTKGLQLRTLYVSFLMVLGAFFIYEWEINHGVSIISARTVVSTVIIFVELIYLFSCRSLTDPVTRIGVFTNRWALLGALLMVTLQLLFVYLPVMQYVFQTAAIPLTAWLDIIIVAVSTSIVVEVEKWVRRRRANQQDAPFYARNDLLRQRD